MDRFKRKYVRDPITGRFVPYKEPRIPTRKSFVKPVAEVDMFALIDYVDQLEEFPS